MKNRLYFDTEEYDRFFNTVGLRDNTPDKQLVRFFKWCYDNEFFKNITDDDISDYYMIYKEEVKDLFTVPEDYYLAHCISADFGMGKGIVVEFNKRFDMKRKLQLKYPDYINQYTHKRIGGDCLLEDRILNLITKERYFHKPTIITMRLALEKMKQICLENNIKKIAMPVIGCGLDRLNWADVSEQIKSVFTDTDIEILVCKR